MSPNGSEVLAGGAPHNEDKRSPGQLLAEAAKPLPFGAQQVTHVARQAVIRGPRSQAGSRSPVLCHRAGQQEIQLHEARPRERFRVSKFLQQVLQRKARRSKAIEERKQRNRSSRASPALARARRGANMDNRGAQIALR